MKWMLALAGLLAVSQLMGCQTIGVGIGGIPDRIGEIVGGEFVRDDIDSLKDKPADVAYQSLKNPRFFTRTVLKTIGVDASRYQNSVKEAADRNLTQNDTPARAFEEMVDDLSQKLSSTIPSLAVIKESKNLKALAVGKFKNETGVQSAQISYVVETVADRLLKNQAVTNEFAVIGVDANTRVDILTTIAGANYGDVFQNADGSNFKDVRMKRYHPQDIYVLTGSVFRLPNYDSGVPRMIISTKVRLEHPRTGETIAAEEFKRSYIYHPVRQSWLSDAENEGLRAKMQEAEQKK